MVRVNIKGTDNKGSWHCGNFGQQGGKRSAGVCAVGGKVLTNQVDFVNSVFYQLLDFAEDFCFLAAAQFASYKRYCTEGAVI